MFTPALPEVPVPVCAIANGSAIVAASVVIKSFFILERLSFRVVNQRLFSEGDHFYHNGDLPYCFLCTAAMYKEGRR